MMDHGIASYQALITWYLNKTRGILTNVNSNKTALYWSNEATFYMRYKAGDVLVFWGNSSNIQILK